MTKGSPLSVDGTIRTRSYEKDGVQKVIKEIRGQDYILLERRSDRDEAIDGIGIPDPAGAASDVPPDADIPADDDLPL